MFFLENILYFSYNHQYFISLKNLYLDI